MAAEQGTAQVGQGQDPADLPTLLHVEEVSIVAEGLLQHPLPAGLVKKGGRFAALDECVPATCLIVGEDLYLHCRSTFFVPLICLVHPSTIHLL